MKNNISSIRKLKIQKTIFENNKFNSPLINIINTQNTLFENISFKSSYNNLKVSPVLILNIINSHFNIKEFIQPNKYLTQNEISLINEIKEKYENYDISIYNNLDEGPIQPEQFFIPHPPIIYNNYNKTFIMNNISKTNFLNNNNNNFLINSKILERKKLLKTINDQDNENEKKEDLLEPDLECKNMFFMKKKIFGFYKRKSKYIKNGLNKEKKILGRKKKNSGETGTHDKFSKDNMMRKLKNKVIESARKLINKKLKDESNSKYYLEIRKIGGAYSQTLNIKYNFWFYFQKMKTIFQFKMSSKYSKDNLDSNILLIKKLYSNEFINKFPKTKQLLEMTFHQYYHDIFLGENINWTKILDVKEKENKFQIQHFIYNNNLNKDSEFTQYKNSMLKLAFNYEKFFLGKNPRIIHNEHSEKTRDVNEIIKYLNNENYEIIKGKYLIQAIIYRPELKIYMDPLLSDKNIIGNLEFKNLKKNIFENYLDEFNSNHNILGVRKHKIFKIEKIKDKNLENTTN